MLNNFPKKIFAIFSLFIFFINPNSYYLQNENEKNVIQTIIQKGHMQPVSAVAFHPTGNYFASGSMDHTIKVWDVHSGKQILSINIHTGTIKTYLFLKMANIFFQQVWTI